MEEKIVMARLGTARAWLPIHVLAYDDEDAMVQAVNGLASAGIDYSIALMPIVSFYPQATTHPSYRDLRRAL